MSSMLRTFYLNQISKVKDFVFDLLFSLAHFFRIIMNQRFMLLLTSTWVFNPSGLHINISKLIFIMLLFIMFCLLYFMSFVPLIRIIPIFYYDFVFSSSLKVVFRKALKMRSCIFCPRHSTLDILLIHHQNQQLRKNDCKPTLNNDLPKTSV